MNIYVSNLGFGIQTDDLKKMFAPYGEVSSVNIIKDKFTNRSRGFAFVEMPEKRAAERAIHELDSSMLGGRAIKMNEAKEREQKMSKASFY